MENQLWQACKEKDFDSFKNLLADNNTEINAANSNGIRLFNQITKSVLRGELPPEFYYEILKRDDLDINFSDEKNVPAVYEFTDFNYLIHFNGFKQDKSSMKQLRYDMLKALMARGDFNPNVELVQEENESYLKWLNPLGQAIRAHEPVLVDMFSSCGKINLNSPAMESGTRPAFGPNAGKFLKHGETFPIEMACSTLDLDIISNLLNRGAKPTRTALDVLEKEHYYNEEFFHDAKANGIIKEMSNSLKK